MTVPTLTCADREQAVALIQEALVGNGAWTIVTTEVAELLRDGRGRITETKDRPDLVWTLDPPVGAGIREDVTWVESCG